MKNIDVYKIDKDGYIIAINSLGSKYILEDNDIEGVPNFEIGKHYQTGLDRPKTQAQLETEEIQELNNWLDLRRNIEHPDKASKQARLLELLG